MYIVIFSFVFQKKWNCRFQRLRWSFVETTGHPSQTIQNEQNITLNEKVIEIEQKLENKLQLETQT